MQQGTRIVFDEMLNAEAGLVLYTSLEHTDFLSGADQLGLHAVFSTSGSGTLALDVRIQQSADGRNWLDKSTHPELSGTVSVTPGQCSLIGGESWPTFPRLRFVTLAITMWTRNLSPPASRLQLFATARSRTRVAPEPTVAPPRPGPAPVTKREAMARLLEMRPSTLEEVEEQVRGAQPGDGLGRLSNRISPAAREDLARITRILRNLGPEQKRAALTFASAFASLVMLPPDSQKPAESTEPTRTERS